MKTVSPLTLFRVITISCIIISFSILFTVEPSYGTLIGLLLTTAVAAAYIASEAVAAWAKEEDE